MTFDYFAEYVVPLVGYTAGFITGVFIVLISLTRSARKNGLTEEWNKIGKSWK